MFKRGDVVCISDNELTRARKIANKHAVIKGIWYVQTKDRACGIDKHIDCGTVLLETCEDKHWCRIKDISHKVINLSLL